MKKIYLLTALVACISMNAQELIISGIIDGPLSGGTPKAIEFLALESIPDLSIFGFGSANNGGGTDGQEFDFSGSASAGDFIYVSTSAADNDSMSPTFGQTFFEIYFGFPPTFISGDASINGDDAIELFKNGAVIDLFGDIGTSGSGEDWDYVDGWAYRNDNSTPNATFSSSDWSFSGPNALDGETSNSTAATPFPTGTFTSTVLSNPQISLLKSETVLFPNPSPNGKITLQTPITSKVKVTLFDSLGAEVSAQAVSDNEEISTKELAAGIYFAQLTVDGNTTTKRIVVQ